MHKPKRLRYARDKFIETYVSYFGENEGIEIDKNFISMEYIHQNKKMHRKDFMHVRNRYDFFSDFVARVNREYWRIKKANPDCFNNRDRRQANYGKDTVCDYLLAGYMNMKLEGKR